MENNNVAAATKMKGIILAGGSGSRLYPLTKVVSKALLPIYDKPMIYYPLFTLIDAGIKDILIITNENDQSSFKKFLGNGEIFGIDISYEIQYEPKGIADAFIIGEKFIGNDPTCLILGDNIFYDKYLTSKMNFCGSGALVFAKKVADPERFGIVEFDKNFVALSIEEKPENPKSNYAVTGLYFYDNSVCEKAKRLKPSARGELEITDLNKLYLNEGKLKIAVLDDDSLWADAGTFDSLLDAGNMVKKIQSKKNIKIGNIFDDSF